MTQYCYSRFGQMMRKVQTTNGKTFVLRYLYSRSGRLLKLTYPDGSVADYTRDAQGRVTNVSVTPAGGTNQVLLNQVSYYPYGPAGQWSYGNGRMMQRGYNLNYWPAWMTDTAAGGLSLGYRFDAAGNAINK